MTTTQSRNFFVFLRHFYDIVYRKFSFHRVNKNRSDIASHNFVNKKKCLVQVRGKLKQSFCLKIVKIMDLGEEGHVRKSDHGDDDNEEKDAESKPDQPSNLRGSRKTESARKPKNSRSNSGQNRRESSRSRSRSKSRQSLKASSKKSWKSANAWLNFMQDFRESLRGYPAIRAVNVFRLAGERWSEMSPEQKKPYIDAANKVKRMKQQDNDNERRSESKMRGKGKKTGISTKAKNQKKKKRNDAKEEKSDSESDFGTEGSAKEMESDNASLDTDGSI